MLSVTAATGLSPTRPKNHAADAAPGTLRITSGQIRELSVFAQAAPILDVAPEGLTLRGYNGSHFYRIKIRNKIDFIPSLAVLWFDCG